MVGPVVTVAAVVCVAVVVAAVLSAVACVVAIDVEMSLVVACVPEEDAVVSVDLDVAVVEVIETQQLFTSGSPELTVLSQHICPLGQPLKEPQRKLLASQVTLKLHRKLD